MVTVFILVGIFAVVAALAVAISYENKYKIILEEFVKYSKKFNQTNTISSKDAILLNSQKDIYGERMKLIEPRLGKTKDQLLIKDSEAIRKSLLSNPDGNLVVANPNDSIKENPKSLLETLSEEQITKLTYPNSYLTREMLANMTDLDELNYKDINNIHKVNPEELSELNRHSISNEKIVEGVTSNGPAILTQKNRKQFQGNPYINQILQKSKNKPI